MEELTGQQIEMVEVACGYMREIARTLGMHISIFVNENRCAGQIEADAIVRIGDGKSVSFHVTEDTVIRRICEGVKDDDAV